MEEACAWIVLAKQAQEQTNTDARIHLQKGQSTNENSSDCMSTRGAVRFLSSRYRCWSWLFWPFQWWEVCEKERRAMMFIHTFNSETVAHRSGIEVRYRYLSQYNHAIHCAGRQTGYNNQRKCDRLSWRWTKVYRVRCCMEQGRDRRASKFNPTAAPQFGEVWERLVISCKKTMQLVLGNRSVTGNGLSATVCIVEQKLNARPLTPDCSDANDSKTMTPDYFLLDHKNVCLP